MGFFSKCCAKSQLPIIASWRNWPELSRVVVLQPRRRPLIGVYDGYGRVDFETIENFDRAKFVLAKHYKGEAYGDLPRSHDELAQGYFMSDKFLAYCVEAGSFKNRAEYLRVFKRLAEW
jgi:hypothetical protein